MRVTFIGILLITVLIITQESVNCQSSDDDGGDSRSFEGDVEESNQGGNANNNSNKKTDEVVDDRKKQTEAKLSEQEDLRPRSHFTEDRFTQLFVPRNSRRKLVSARYTTKPKPTLPSFIKKPISVPPPDIETPAPRGSFSQSSSASRSSSRTTSTTTTTPRPGRGRGRSSTTSTTTTTESSYRRGIFSTRKPAAKLFPNRNRN